MNAAEDLHAQFAPSVLHAEIVRLRGLLAFTTGERDRLRAELAETRSENDELCAMSLELQAALAALARVRELCASHAGDDDIPRASVLAALEGEQA